jgi:dTDP-4-dehydrorhamnose reductase
MNILILGKGYIGNYLAPFLHKERHKVFHVSKRSVNYANPEELKSYLKNLNEPIHFVINCSGYTGSPNVDACEDHKEDCYFYNVTAPLYITRVCNDLKIPIIHIGSGCVYSGYDKIYTEDDPTDFGADNINSSTYSKSKDTFEKLSANLDRYIFRIRIPFNGVLEPKNYLYKMIKYNNLISKQNSITCVDDLLDFINKFISTHENYRPYGIYNVVNKGCIDGAEVVDMLRDNEINNPNWKFVTIKEANFRVARSNCILSTKKLEKINLGLPDVRESLKRAIFNYSLESLRNV